MTFEADRISATIKFILVLLVAGLIFSWMGISVTFILLLLIWSLALFYSFSDMRRRGLLAAFLVAFFVFLMGGHFVHEFFGYRLSHYLGDDYYHFSNQLLLISLSLVFICHLLTENLWFSRPAPPSRERESWEQFASSQKTIRLGAIARTLFLVTYPFWFYINLDKILFVLSRGYLSYYTGYMASMSYLFRAVGTIAPYAFYVFLATMPSRKNIKLPLTLFAIHALASLLTGRRIEFAVMVLFMAVYYLVRHQLAIRGEPWLTRRMVFGLILLIPFFLFFLFAFNYLRLGASSGASSLWSGMLGFLQQQGISSSLIRLERYHQAALGDHHYYSLFGLLKWVRTNGLLGLLVKFDYGFSYIGNSIPFASLGNSLSNTLSLIVLGEKRYLEGLGLGSCYIAELFHDFGYWGVGIGNAIYGSLMAALGQSLNKQRKSVFAIAMLFILFESFVKAPRWNFDIVFAQMLNLAMWASLAVIWALNYLWGDYSWDLGPGGGDASWHAKTI